MNNTAVPGQNYPLADRLVRLQAFLIDSAIGALFNVFIFQYYDLFDRLANQEAIPFSTFAVVAIYDFFVFVLINSYLLYYFGQTIGKKLMGIAIATPEYRVPNFNRVLLLRYLPFRLMSIIPGMSLVAFFEPISIFRSDRRCIHDLMANTIVINIKHESGGKRR